MCRLILTLPVLGLTVFWLWPRSIAAPVYAVIVVISLFFYYLMMRAMRRPVATGREEILRKSGTVIEARERRIRVRVRNELWNAESSDKLRPGDTVKITGIQGLVLLVRRSDPAPAEEVSAKF